MTDRPDYVAVSRHLESTLGVPPAIRVNGKAPLDAGWTTGPRRKPSEWRRRLAGHTGNLGMLTGNGLVAIDVDLYHSGAVDSIEALYDLGLPRETVTAITGRGGRHLLYRTKAQVPSRALEGYPGIDVKGEGGMIVVAPSVHPDSGLGYEWEHSWGPGDVEPAELPERIVELLTEPEWASRALDERDEASVNLLLEHYHAHDPRQRGGWIEVTRPGKNHGASASIGRLGPGVVKVWSTHWDGLPAGLYHLSDLRRLAGIPGPKLNVPRAPSGLVVKRISEVEPEVVTWVWPGYLPAGKLVVLDGDPSVGKSTLVLDIGARVSACREMPDGSIGWEGVVVIMSAEDGLADTIRPRLDAAGADIERVIAITEVADKGDVFRPPRIPDDVARLEMLVTEHHAVLVIIDVLVAYLSSETNSYRDQDVRQALAPLAKMAEKTGCCVVVLRHLRKGSSSSAIYAGGGSIAIVGAARVGLMAAFDPDDEELDDLNERRRVLAVVKNNIGKMAPSLSYRIVEDRTFGTSRIEWLGPATHRADDLVDREHRDDERNDKEAFLRDLLTDGPVPVNDVEKAANDAGGWTLKQLRKPLRRIGGRSRHEGNPADGDRQQWVWTLDKEA
jgi:RecA/RadA recombinase